MKKLFSIRVLLLSAMLLSLSNLLSAQSVSFNVTGTNPHCESAYPNGAPYSGAAIAPSGAVQIVDVTFQIQRLGGTTWAFWGAPFTLTAGTSATSVGYNNNSLGATQLTLSPTSTIRMRSIIRYRTAAGGNTVFTSYVYSASVTYNYFSSPTVDYSINNQFAPSSPTVINVYTCAGDVTLQNLTNISGTGVQWRLQMFSSTSGGNQGTPFDVNMCGWKNGVPPASLNVSSTENNPVFAGCFIRPRVYTEGEYVLVRLEMKNDCGTSSKNVLLRFFSQPSGATVNFFFRGSNNADALATGSNTQTGSGEQNSATGTVSNSDGILSWGGTQANPTWVGAAQTSLDVSGTNFYGGVLSWTVEISYQNPQTNAFVPAGTHTISAPGNSLISILDVVMSVGGGTPSAAYFISNFNTSPTGVLGKLFKVKLTGNGVCNQSPSKEGFFKIAPNFIGWLPVNGNNTGEDVAQAFYDEVVEDLQVAPNPANGQITVTVESNEEVDAVLRVVDMNGQIAQLNSSSTLSLTKGYNSFTSDISQLPAGTYVIQVVKPSGILTQKLIKL